MDTLPVEIATPIVLAAARDKYIVNVMRTVCRSWHDILSHAGIGPVLRTECIQKFIERRDFDSLMLYSHLPASIVRSLVRAAIACDNGDILERVFDRWPADSQLHPGRMLLRALKHEHAIAARWLVFNRPDAVTYCATDHGSIYSLALGADLTHALLARGVRVHSNDLMMFAREGMCDIAVRMYMTRRYVGDVPMPRLAHVVAKFGTLEQMMALPDVRAWKPDSFKLLKCTFNDPCTDRAAAKFAALMHSAERVGCHVIKRQDSICIDNMYTRAICRDTDTLVRALADSGFQPRSTWAANNEASLTPTAAACMYDHRLYTPTGESMVRAVKGDNGALAQWLHSVNVGVNWTSLNRELRGLGPAAREKKIALLPLQLRARAWQFIDDSSSDDVETSSSDESSSSDDY